MVVGEQLHLPRRGLDEPLLAVTERGAPKPGPAVEQLSRSVVVDVNALPACDDLRALGLVLNQIGEGVQALGDVPSP